MPDHYNLKIRDRNYFIEQEEKFLAPYAVTSTHANETRLIHEEEHPYRTAIQRDRDRIIHSRAFRRLKHKRQVFLISEGDHYRTRLTHTLEVSQLSRTIAKAFGLNEELVEAIALGHDLGHTPFGHAGEVVLNNILTGQDLLDGLLTGKNYGGFKHNYQSLRVIDEIEKEYYFDGLNLTSYVREGILKHTSLKRGSISYPGFITKGIYFDLDNATSLEGQVVSICDEIAQRTHDLEDGLIAGYVDLVQVMKLDIIKYVEEKYSISPLLKSDQNAHRNTIINALISLLISDIIQTSFENIVDFYQRTKRNHYFDEEIIKFSNKVNPLQLELDAFIHEEIIHKSSTGEVINQNIKILRELFKVFVKNPKRIEKMLDKNKYIDDEHTIRIITDYIAGMTDRFAELEIQKL